MAYKTLNPEHFTLTEGNFCGREAVLVTPSHSDAGWTKDNLSFRSIVYDKTSNEVLSHSFPKFFNEGQNPELYPNPLDFDDWEIYEKVDGSTLILDVVDGKLSMRTRGILNYRTQQNAADFELLFAKYPRLIPFVMDKAAESFTMLFEIVTPNNKIVLDYGPEVDFYFIGMINKANGYINPEYILDATAFGLGLKRPRKYDFSDIDDLKEVVKAWKSEEGVVISYDRGQSKIKVKSDRYCFLHKVMSGLLSKKDIVERFVNLGFPKHEDFFNHYIKEYDYEIAMELQGEIAAICFDYETLKVKMANVETFVKSIDMPSFSRAEMAKQIMHRYANGSWERGYSFNVLDNKKLEDTVLKKLLLNK